MCAQPSAKLAGRSQDVSTTPRKRSQQGKAHKTSHCMFKVTTCTSHLTRQARSLRHSKLPKRNPPLSLEGSPTPPCSCSCKQKHREGVFSWMEICFSEGVTAGSHCLEQAY